MRTLPLGYAAEVVKRRFKLDWYVTAIFGSAVLATLLPASGVAVPILDWATKIAIAGLFFVYGVRLHPRDALAGLTHWRLHTTILSFTYVVFPLLGLALRILSPGIVSPALYAGMLYVCLVPSTVQSSIAFTSIAKGNVAGAIVSASASNLLGVVITPVLATALMSTTGGATVDPSSIIDIMLQILLPFVLGQLSRRWLAEFVESRPRLRLFDQVSVLLIVYAAFSTGMREGMWTKMSVGNMSILLLVCAVILAVMLTVTWVVPKRLGFTRPDLIAIQFCGTKKSLVTGLPMAVVLFAGQDIGLLVLPLMVFHQMQLMVCGWLAGRYGREVGAEATPADKSRSPDAEETI